MNIAAKPACAPSELLARRLSSFRPLQADDLAPLSELGADDHAHAAGAELSLGQGETRLVTAGLVGEARLLSDGRRQIVALRLPGDILTPGYTANHVISALAPSRTLDATALLSRLGDPRAAPALHAAWAEARRMEQRAVLDHVVRLGRLSAYERTAHLLLELHERLVRVKLAQANGFQLPITQEIMADLLGLSIVHVNRTLQQLRREGLLTYRAGSIGLPDRTSLAEACGYALQLSPTEPGRRRAG
ncbi:helix-turn-helix domain-containing protein [Phenylobacterium sp. J426]|uniref:Crp/Fnr family transcriptional regulator n=1 Tax=Phenylobacterium sp. J426 TaxID=2898439 RepID=UPI002150E05A|nr:helix-turn-helix domain-containing protein [Phenylobacterium sp. J426]MCR5874810.1 helix-turn-helix domain-containing protein [Phenylobacterium sp. J426]